VLAAHAKKTGTISKTSKNAALRHCSSWDSFFSASRFCRRVGATWGGIESSLIFSTGFLDVVGQTVAASDPNWGTCPVIIAFSTKKLRSLCEFQTKAEREYGLEVAKQLRARLADLREAETVLELPAGRPREIDGAPHKNYALDLADGYWLVLSVNHGKVPVLKTGGVDWARVSRIKIQKIEVCHA
jgi:proteic killer suppression protein